jgi:hypothetical protein
MAVLGRDCRYRAVAAGAKLGTCCRKVAKGWCVAPEGHNDVYMRWRGNGHHETGESAKSGVDTAVTASGSDCEGWQPLWRLSLLLSDNGGGNANDSSF